MTYLTYSTESLEPHKQSFTYSLGNDSKKHLARHLAGLPDGLKGNDQISLMKLSACHLLTSQLWR